MKARPLHLVAALGLSVAVTLSAASTAGQVPAAEASTPIYLDPSYSARERAIDLVSRMTLQEKASQMISSQAPAIPRLGVKAYGWWNEAAHGVAREQYNDGDDPKVLTNTTSYPVSLSMGSTWNPDLMYRVATQTSNEAREVVRNNTLDLSFYSPTINLSRDPRWGRNDETFSEDPLLTAKMGSQFVNGMEGKNTNGELLPAAEGYLKTSTTIKHFAANNSEFNRLTGSSNMDKRTLREYYTSPFKKVIRNSDPGSIMAAYNSVNGVPASANVHLLDTLARKTFGFDGFFTSDCDSVYLIEEGHHWQPANKEKPVNHIERSAYANAAGIDLNCSQGFHGEYHYGNTLPTAANKRIKTHNGVYTENFMDASLVRMFTVRIKLGEFDDPQHVPWVRQARERVPKGSWENSNANNAVTQTPKRLDLAAEAASESIVLLRNKPNNQGDKLLPLKVPESGKFRVAVIGNHAKKMHLGGYSSNQGPAGLANSTTGYEGIKAAIKAINPDAVVDYLPGTAPGTEHKLNTETVAKSANYDVAIVYAGTGEETASEGNDRENLTLPRPQTALINKVAAKNPNTVAYMETVGAVDVRSFNSDVSALLWSSYNGQRKGEALANVLLGQVNPSGHLPFTWNRSESQLPPIDHYGIRPTESQPGRTYMYFDGDVSYPLGYGLSYTNFEYTDLRIDRQSATPNGTVHVSATVTNTGQRSGTDVIQLYAATPKAEKAQIQDKRLVAFEKVSLNPGQSKRVEFDVQVRDLALFDPKQDRFEVTNGDYTLQLARSSTKSGIEQHATFEVHGKLKLRPVTASTTARAKGDAERGITIRKIYPPDTVIQPRLTVSMNDGTLRGYVAEGDSRPLPPGTVVDYSSNRPEVVSVDGHNTIQTRGPGVATITATVKYHGATTKTSFVVKVE